MAAPLLISPSLLVKFLQETYLTADWLLDAGKKSWKDCVPFIFELRDVWKRLRT